MDPPRQILNGPAPSVRRGAWSEHEDGLLRRCIETYGEGNWHKVPLRAGLQRCHKSCRLRWKNYLSPNIKRGEFSNDEVDLIIKMYKLLGNRWSLIAGRLPGRTDNDVKNYWNTKLSRQLRPEFKPIGSASTLPVTPIKPQESRPSKEVREFLHEMTLRSISSSTVTKNLERSKQKHEYFNEETDEDHCKWLPEPCNSLGTDDFLRETNWSFDPELNLDHLEWDLELCDILADPGNDVPRG